MGIIKKCHIEKEAELEWKTFLEAVGETPKIEESPLAFVPDMDTEGMLERGEVLKFFRQNRYRPHMEAPLREALDGLPLKQMAVLHGIFLRNLTVKEIAREMNCSHDSVRGLKSKAIKTLRKTLIPKKGGVTLKMTKKPPFSQAKRETG